MTVQTKDHVIIRTGGSSFTQFKPLFSLDERFLLCPCAESIKVFSIETGECCQVLEAHKENVTCIAHHPTNKLQILSCSTDFTVRRWAYEDGVLLYTYDTGMPLFMVLTSKHYENQTFIVCKNNTDGHELRKLDLSRTDDEHHKSDLIDVKLPESNFDRLISFGEKFLMIGNKRKLTFFEIESKKQVGHRLKAKSSKICCVAAHPSGDQCVTGHEDGVINFWTGLQSSSDAVTNSEHWHSQSVMALGWSPNGVSLFSGGHEGVMVHWHNQQRYFTPRIDPIRHIVISSSNTLRATVHTDNSIKLFTSYDTQKQVIEGFTASSEGLHCGLQVDPISSSFVTNGKLGHLLFYDPVKDFQLKNLDVVNRNFPSSSDQKHKLSRVQITKLAFLRSVDKDVFMATLEFDVEKKRDQKLKFWKYDQTSQQWSLDTKIASPHADQDVTSLCFHPYEPLCVTTSVDGLAKVWVHHDVTGWSSMGAIQHKMYPCNDCDFSQDGSLIALAFQQAVCVRDVSSLDYRTSKVFTHAHQVLMLKFGYNESNRFLVTCTRDFYHSWDMVTGCMQWTMDLSEQPSLILPDPLSQHMLLLTADNSIRIFNPDSSEIVYNQQMTFEVASAAFHPQSENTNSYFLGSQLYIVSTDMVVYTLCSKEDAAVRSQPKPKLALGINNDSLLTPMSLYLNVNSDNSTSKRDLKSGAYVPRRRTIEESVKALLDCPAHVLPPIKSLADQFITSLILDGATSKAAKSKEGLIENMEVDDSVSDANNNQLDERKYPDKTDIISSKCFNFVKTFYNK